MSDVTLTTSPNTFEWRRWPETEAFVDRLIERGLEGNALAAELAQRMPLETGTRFKVWLDHVVVRGGPALGRRLQALGYAREPGDYDVGNPVFGHSGGMFPRIVILPQARQGAETNGAEDPREIHELALKVESVAAFSRALDLGLAIEGAPLGPYRVGRVGGAKTALAVVERRGYLGFDPFPGELTRQGRMTPASAREALAARELWEGRKRRYDDDEEGIAATEKLLDKVIEKAGSRDLACHLIFEVERDYWQSRNHAARVQKARQDRLGLGWANHDHHTFRCSRGFFPRIIAMFTKLGFNLREGFHAGQHAGWGAQIVEQPVTGIVIFADLDLAPDEAQCDFTHIALPPLPRPGTVGLWVALHGESILEAGMHHLEAQFDFDLLRDGLKAEAGIETMPPFSNFPFLRQAFTAGERWRIDRGRLDRALEAGWITPAEHARFEAEGTIGSHLENLERREGYKGFNQQAVSSIIAATDPRQH